MGESEGFTCNGETHKTKFNEKQPCESMDKFEDINRNSRTHLTKSNEKQTHQTIVWRNVILFTYLHLAALYGVLLVFTSAKIATTIFGILNIKLYF